MLLETGMSRQFAGMAKPASGGVAPTDTATLAKIARGKAFPRVSRGRVQYVRTALIADGAKTVQCCSFHRHMARQSYLQDSSG